MENTDVLIPKKPGRNFLPENLNINTWDDIKQYYEELVVRSIDSLDDLRKWLKDRSELNAVVSEDFGWKYISMTCDTTDADARKAFEDFTTQIDPHISSFGHKLNIKLINCDYISELGTEYAVYLRHVKKSIEIFREENIPIQAEMQVKQSKYGEITGAMTVEMNGEEMTLQQASNFLQDLNRDVRKEAFLKIYDRRFQDSDKLNELFSELIDMRQKIADNAGFNNYRDYKFAELGRFDYTPEDCMKFHESIAEELVPIIRELMEKKRKVLKVDQLKPWDTAVDFSNKPPLKPFKDVYELIDKSMEAFDRTRSFFGECLATMNKMNRLDLASRKGKAPGGYMYPLLETDVPFIFMNASGDLGDVTTMMHEGGHAVQYMLMKDLEITGFKDLPSEIAELASMSMELFTFDHWDVFFKDEEELKRAKVHQLERVLTVLPMVSTIDLFQHWLYTHPGHTTEERIAAWEDIFCKYQFSDWSGLDKYLEMYWQRVLHLYEVPFYYVEYAMAQLGAIAMWKQYKENKEKALDNYMNAISQGYTMPIGEIYKEAGIEFDFSREYIHELAQFVKQELDELI